jgi:peptidoglycan/xylan/chitin deacetylase (PgdA/CDA1 family)
MLRRERATATFFVIAPRAARHAELIAEMVHDGHEVQLHCDRHVRHTDLTDAGVCGDAQRALVRLAELGTTPSHWRAPWGVCTPATRRVAAERGLTLVGWNVDTHDWRGDSAQDMHARIAGELQDGSVVLMHDGLGPGACRTGCPETLDLIPRLLDTLRARGLVPAPVEGAEPGAQARHGAAAWPGAQAAHGAAAHPEARC